jgi:hypothetical protein
MKKIILSLLLIANACFLSAQTNIIQIPYNDTGKNIIRLMEFKNAQFYSRGYFDGTTVYTPSAKCKAGFVGDTANYAKIKASIDSLSLIIQTLKNGTNLVKITDGTNIGSVKASGTASTNSDVAQVVVSRPSTALFGSTTPTVTAYNTDANTITTTNCVRIIVENKSTTTDGSISYGGVILPIGKKNNTSGYFTLYTFEAPFDWPSQKYSPLAALIVNAASANIVVTKYFTQ